MTGRPAPYHVDEQVQIGCRGAPVADRRAQRDVSTVDSCTREHPVVVEQRLAEPAVDGVQVRLGATGRPIPEADHVQRYLGQPLQTPCAGHTLWAFNARHLAYLKQFLQAELRERRGTANASVISRLPTWIKEAKHRDAALRAVERLEHSLTTGR